MDTLAPSTSDAQARRIAALAVTFANATAPLTGARIQAAHYPNATAAAFARAFHRDRATLASCGIVVANVGTTAAPLWQATADTWANAAELTAADALLLDVVCLPLTTDPAFPRRAELRHALAKIDRAYSGLAAAHAAEAAPQGVGTGAPTRDTPAAARLLACLATGHLARIGYVDAAGQATTRIIAPYGTFGLRGNTYVVAADLTAAHAAASTHAAKKPTRAAAPARPIPGSVRADADTPIRTFRLSRVTHATQLAATFQTPATFDAADYVALPFQLGPTVATATFSAGADAEPRALAALRRAAARHARNIDRNAPASANATSEEPPGEGPCHGADGRRVQATGAGGRHGGRMASADDHRPCRPAPPAGTGFPLTAPQVAAAPERLAVSVSNVSAAATWAIASGIVPLDPPALVAAWRRTLAAAARTRPRVIAPPASTSAPGGARGNPRAHAGRRGGVGEARTLVALVGALSAEGTTLSAATVAARLGVTRARAAELLGLLLTAGTSDGAYLPLAADDEGDRDSTITLAFCSAGTLRGRPARLTAAETDALAAALDAADIARDDPLRASVVTAFAPSSIHEDGGDDPTPAGAAGPHAPQAGTASPRGGDAPGSAANALLACARACLDGIPLAFAYQGTADAAPRTRVVRATRITHADDHWYLTAHDLAAQDSRTFRIDRMRDAHAERAAGTKADNDAPTSAGATAGAAPATRPAPRTVTVAFTDERCLLVLDWPGIAVVGHDRANGVTVARIPWYGTTWLPRHLAACGADAHVEDPDLAAAIRAAAQAPSSREPTVS